MLSRVGLTLALAYIECLLRSVLSAPPESIKLVCSLQVAVTQEFCAFVTCRREIKRVIAGQCTNVMSQFIFFTSLLVSWTWNIGGVSVGFFQLSRCCRCLGFLSISSWLTLFCFFVTNLLFEYSFLCWSVGQSDSGKQHWVQWCANVQQHSTSNSVTSVTLNRYLTLPSFQLCFSAHWYSSVCWYKMYPPGFYDSIKELHFSMSAFSFKKTKNIPWSIEILILV